MTTKYDPKKELKDSVVDAAWLTGGLAWSGGAVYSQRTTVLEVVGSIPAPVVVE